MDATVIRTDREFRAQPIRLLGTTFGVGLIFSISIASLATATVAAAESPPVLDPVQVTGPSCGNGLVPIFSGESFVGCGEFGGWGDSGVPGGGGGEIGGGGGGGGGLPIKKPLILIKTPNQPLAGPMRTQGICMPFTMLLKHGSGLADDYRQSKF